jgi:hypothetical protein
MSKTKFELSHVSGVHVSDEDLLSDLRRVAQSLGIRTVANKKYSSIGTYSAATIAFRFGSWNNALIAAGLEISNEFQISDERLLENLLVLWQHLGRQPRRRDLANKISIFSEGPYIRRFGSWTAALKSFIEYANATESIPQCLESLASDLSTKKTPRDPSLRLRSKVLLRDRFSCRQCGASPATTLGVELHLDHIVPWSKGGETTLENLQTLCSKCNLGKSNLEQTAQ